MKYKGMNFQEWCKLDAEDNRKINYTLKGVWDAEEQEVQFTSDDYVDALYLYRLTRAEIEKIKLVNNEWFVTLIY